MQNINFECLPEKFVAWNSGLKQKRTLEKLSELEYHVSGDELPKNGLKYGLAEIEILLSNGTWQIVHVDNTQKEDVIQKPSHYHKNEIDVNGYLEKHFPLEGSYTVAEGFYIGNVIKYTSRYKDKGGKQDLEKAKFNLNKLIELEESR
jgi:hypothetical protein